MKRRELLTCSVSAGVAVAGCLGTDDGADSSAHVVSVSEHGYEPRELSVDVGATVTWVNENSTVASHHTVTSDPFLEESANWSFDEELSEEGDDVSYTFEEEGLYTYVGTIRGADCMCGLVEVGGVSHGDPLPCSPVRGGGC
ncbi:plastocyanin/azurin family copper-binding protein [Halobacteria archaeon AArc-m2/3/4]|uniref:Plastocyanin/azurin family copper-binding protein n=1 Tax=Natronoglomus mannanivorans TaxID=2979990 RepID=A0AAP2YV51_9EURY|nr:plastocyanin/azurin family copper-binding protein [Halobacteria archaeon AArc-xg1-1]MCU4971806.1 plastocyanin/azurin family copper-binding protein [Halobacteria archaeon AArc-m2/3/4]